MKISYGKKCTPVRLTISRVPSGSVVRFKRAFHQIHRDTDLFIVNTICNSYVPECIKQNAYYNLKREVPTHGNGKYRHRANLHPHDADDFGGAGLTNLRTGALAFVCGDKECVVVDAEVCNLGDSTCV